MLILANNVITQQATGELDREQVLNTNYYTSQNEKSHPQMNHPKCKRIPSIGLFSNLQYIDY